MRRTLGETARDESKVGEMKYGEERKKAISCGLY